MIQVDQPHQFRLETNLPRDTRLPFRICWVVGLLLLVLAGLGFWQLQPVIPLFYSLAQPTQQLAPKYWIFLFPMLSLSTTMLNFWLLRRNSDLEPILITLISWTTAIWQIALLVTGIRLLLIVW